MNFVIIIILKSYALHAIYKYAIIILVISLNFEFLCKMRSWVHDVLGVVISSTRRAQSPECVHKALYAIACTKPCMRAQCVFPFEVKRNTWHPKGFQKVFTWLCIQTMTTDMRWIHSVSESRVHVRYLPLWLVSSIRVQPCRACVLYDAYLYAQSARLCMTF